MGHIPLLGELAIIAVVGVLVTVLLARLRLPTVAGLLAAGALIGPFGGGLITSVHDIEMLAEVGVVLLLFTIGLEFSLARLRTIFRRVALGGVLQVGLTFGVTVAVARAAGSSAGVSVFFGFIVALSSTAIVLRTLAERSELDAPHGRFIVGTLLFQDLCVVPMMLVVPLLAADIEGGASGPIVIALGKAAAVVVATVVIARVLVPRLLTWVDASRSREVFLLAIVALCIGTAYLTALAGLSLALGAFLGGMVVADTEYGHRAMSDILPLRDTFVSVFFVVLGMLFDPRVLLAEPALVLAFLAAFLFGKGAIAVVAALAMRFPPRAAWLAGVGLAQFGEFGFVLTRVAQSNGLVDAADIAPLLTAGIISMFLTPMLVRLAPHITAGERLLAPLAQLFGVRGIEEAAESRAALDGHVVIVGFGIGGTFAARALQACETPVIVLDLSIEAVRRGKALGLPIYYGDATSAETLQHAHLAAARALVVLVDDPPAADRIVATARRIAPETPILMRSRSLSDRDRLLSIGADDVVATEVEGAVEVVARLLRALDVPRNVIDDRIHMLRSDTQPTARRPTVPRRRLGGPSGLADLRIESALVRPGSPAAGQSPVSLRLRSQTGALVVGTRRGDALLHPTDPNTPFEAGDIVYLVGVVEAIDRALALFDAPGGEPAA